MSNPEHTGAEPTPSASRRPDADPSRPTRLWLIRHAEIEAAYQGVFGGTIDMDLSPRGHEQAGILAQYLHRQPVQCLYASPMRRVQQTLAPLRINGAPRPVILPELREIDFGIWTGLAFHEVEGRFGVSPETWLEQIERAAIPQAECTLSLRERLEPCLRRVLQHHAGQEVALVCHGGVIRVLLSMLLGLPLPRTAAFKIEYASITRIVLEPEPELQLLNLVPWRDLGS